jgi:hypothetical protein
MAIESLVWKKYFLTSEQSECFASLSIEGAKYVVQKVFKSVFKILSERIHAKCIKCVGITE